MAGGRRHSTQRAGGGWKMFRDSTTRRGTRRASQNLKLLLFRKLFVGGWLSVVCERQQRGRVYIVSDKDGDDGGWHGPMVWLTVTESNRPANRKGTRVLREWVEEMVEKGMRWLSVHSIEYPYIFLPSSSELC